MLLPTLPARALLCLGVTALLGACAHRPPPPPGWIRPPLAKGTVVSKVVGNASGLFTVVGEAPGGGRGSFFRLDLLVSQYDALGRERWHARRPKPGWESVRDVAADTEGEVLLTGCTDDQGMSGFLIRPPGPLTSDAFVMRYDAAGQLLWRRELGSVFEDCGAEVAFDAAGNGLLLLSTHHAYRAGPGTSSVAKYAPDGRPLWLEELSSPASSMVVGPRGEVFVLGWAQRGEDGRSDVVRVTQLSPQGDEQWTWELDAGPTFHALAADAHGNVYLAGTEAAGAEDPRPRAVLRKLAAAGGQAWRRPLGTGINNLPLHLEVEADGSVAAVVRVDPFAPLPGEREEGTLWRLRYDSEGHLLRSHRFGSRGDRFHPEIAVPGTHCLHTADYEPAFGKDLLVRTLCQRAAADP